MKSYEADACAERILANKCVVNVADTRQTRQFAALIADARMLARHRLATRSLQEVGIEPGHPLYTQALTILDNYRIPVSVPAKKRKVKR